MPTHGKKPQATGLQVGDLVKNRYGDWVKVPACLGPGMPLHGYLGDSPGNRMCPRCRRIQDSLHLSPTMLNPPADHGADQ